MTSEIVLELLKLAEKLAAPFIERAAEKLKSELFGNGRAARSTDVVIHNSTGISFKLKENFCGTGGWTSTMLPEEDIPVHSSVVYGAESYGFMTGCTNCTVKYASADNSSSFELCTSNAYIGSVQATAIAKGIKIEIIKSEGNNNLVRFVLQHEQK